MIKKINALILVCMMFIFEHHVGAAALPNTAKILDDIQGYTYKEALINKGKDAKTKNGSLQFIQSKQGQKVIIGTEADLTINSLPQEVYDNSTYGSFNGYIIELTQPSLLEKENQLNPAIEKNLGILTESSGAPLSNIDAINIKPSIETKVILQAQSRLIAAEQQTAENIIKSVAAKAKIRKRHATVVNALTVKDLTNAEASTLKNKGFKIYPNYKRELLLDASVPQIKAPLVWQTYKDASGNLITGKNVRVGIIDTGIDYTHADLGGCSSLGPSCKVIAGYDFGDNDPDPMDEHGHGTHVAATVAGNGALKGVAPDASLIAYKVANINGGIEDDALLSAISSSTDPNGDGNFSDHLDIINLSLGGPGNPDDIVSKAVDRAATLGVLSVIAAANSGPLERTIMSPGVARQALTVGAIDSTGTVTSFSSRGPVIWSGQTLMKPDIMAPGFEICAAQRRHEVSDDSKCGPNWTAPGTANKVHGRMSGTSMATPHVAGAAALLKQMHPDWSPRYIKFALKNSVITNPANPIEYGNGNLDLSVAAKYSNTIIAELLPLPINPVNQLIVKGIINTSSFRKYKLEYRLYSKNFVTDWITFKESVTAPVMKTPIELGILDASALPSAQYLIRLTVELTNGRKGTDHGYINLEKMTLLSPQSGDIYRSGTAVSLGAKKGVAYPNAVVSWKYGLGPTPSSFTAITSNTWNTNALASGVYTLVAELTNSGQKIDQQTMNIYLDSRLKPGWPKRFNYETISSVSGEVFNIWTGSLTPAFGDIDGNADKKQEIAILKGGNPAKLYVYKSDGTLLWQKSVGQVVSAGGDITTPLIGDINNDGKSEIFVVVTPNVKGETSFSLYGFNGDGTPYSQFASPTKIPIARRGKMSLVNIDGVGSKELVIIGGGSGAKEDRNIVVVNADGNVRSIPVPNTDIGVGFGADTHLAFGNFDNDKELEIVFVTPSPDAGNVYGDDGYYKGQLIKSNIHILNQDGSQIAKSPFKVDGLAIGTPSVGDVDNDGREDIVFGLINYSNAINNSYGGIHVLNREGEWLPGFPIASLKKSVWSSPTLLDINNDKKLEIAYVDFWGRLYLINYRGEVIWQNENNINNQYNSVAVAGVGVAGEPSVLRAGGSFWKNYGIFAYDKNGAAIPGFPLPIENNAIPSVSVADIDGDGKVEIMSVSDWELNKDTYAYKNRSSVYVWDLDTLNMKSAAFWPTFGHDEQHTSRYVDMNITTTTSTAPFVDLTLDNIKVFPPITIAKDFIVDVGIKNPSNQPFTESKAQIKIEVLKDNSSVLSQIYPLPTLSPGTISTIRFSSFNAYPRNATNQLKLNAGTYKLLATLVSPQDSVTNNNSKELSITVIDNTSRVAITKDQTNQYMDLNSALWIHETANVNPDADRDGAPATTNDALVYCKSKFPATQKVEVYTTENVLPWKPLSTSQITPSTFVDTSRCVLRELHISLDPNVVPARIVAAGAKKETFLKARLSAPNADVTITAINISYENTNNAGLSNILIMSDGKLLGSAPVPSEVINGKLTAKITLSAPLVVSAAEQMLEVLADVGVATALKPRLGITALQFTQSNTRVSFLPIFGSILTVKEGIAREEYQHEFGLAAPEVLVGVEKVDDSKVAMTGLQEKLSELQSKLASLLTQVLHAMSGR